VFVDIDSHSASSLSVFKLNSLFRACGLSNGYRALRYSRTKRGWHIVALLHEKLTPIERVCLESILGDDGMRASMNFARARNDYRTPQYWKQRRNILFDYKVQTNDERPKNSKVSSVR
jgi:hypothetical protein